jgi:hypothetical protein
VAVPFFANVDTTGFFSDLTRSIGGSLTNV